MKCITFIVQDNLADGYVQESSEVIFLEGSELNLAVCTKLNKKPKNGLMGKNYNWLTEKKRVHIFNDLVD